MIRVLIVDDHPVVREGVATVLEDRPDLRVVASVGTGEEAVERAEMLAPDVVLLDLELPGMGGLETISRLAEAAPAARVLVFTAYETDDRLFGAIRLGARGYLLKGAAAEEIARAVRAVHDGGSYLEPRVAERVLAELGPSPRRSAAELTGRQREILRLLAEGQANKQIARGLGISERTVKFHVSAILTNLGAENRAHAVSIVARRGLL